MKRVACLCVAVAVLALVQPVRSEDQPETAPKDGPKQAKITSSSYDIGDLVDYRLRIGKGKKRGPYTPEQLIEQVVRAISCWNAEDFRIEAVNHHLEVSATAETHQQVANLLDALRRLRDVEVTYTSLLYEVDAAYWEKNLKAVLADERSPLKQRAAQVGLELAQRLHQNGKPRPIHTEIAANGDEAEICSVQVPHFYRAGADKKAKQEVVYSGVTLVARTQVSADRRFIEIKLEQRARNQQGMLPRDFFNADLERVTIQVPAIVEVACAETIRIDDGEQVLVPIHLRAAAKDKVYVLLLKPEIYIQAEQDVFVESRLHAVWGRLYDWLKINEAALELDRIPAVGSFIIRWLDRAGL